MVRGGRSGLGTLVLGRMIGELLSGPADEGKLDGGGDRGSV